MRLRPLTEDCPKPLVACNGRPFITYVLDQIAKQGITRCLMQAGSRLGHMFEPALGNKYGSINMTYSITDDDWGNGQRLWADRDLLDEEFLLLYNDTYVEDFDLITAVTAHHTRISPQASFRDDRPAAVEPLITLGAIQKRPGNVNIESGGHAAYWISSSPTVGWTDAGYMIMNRDAISGVHHLPNVLQSAGLLGRLSAYEVQNHLTIDTPELLAETERALASLGNDNDADAPVPRGRRDRSASVL